VIAERSFQAQRLAKSCNLSIVRSQLNCAVQEPIRAEDVEPRTERPIGDALDVLHTSRGRRFRVAQGETDSMIDADATQDGRVPISNDTATTREACTLHHLLAARHAALRRRVVSNVQGAQTTIGEALVLPANNSRWASHAATLA
jgi:hypothetical protein